MMDDDTDRVIVRALAADGRASYTDLARISGLSVSAVHQRVRRLETRGVLRGFTAVVDPMALGLNLTAFVSILPFDADLDGDTPRKLEQFAAIESCHTVAGEASYLLKVRVAGPRELEELLSQIRAAANVRTRTTVALSTVWEARPPLL
jgi:Lrp/AsnC family leucine-responsive transcriptional regulator